MIAADHQDQAGRRAVNDSYMTCPGAFTAAFQVAHHPDLHNVPRGTVHVIDLACGPATLALEARLFFEDIGRTVIVTAVELNPAYVKPDWVDNWYSGDALALIDDLRGKADIVVCNPPFVLAEAFARMGVALLRHWNARSFILARSALWGSQGRAEFRKLYTPKRMHWLVPRMSFYALLDDSMKSKTDREEYAIFEFDGMGEQRDMPMLSALDWTPMLGGTDVTDMIRDHKNLNIARQIWVASRKKFGVLLDDTASLVAARELGHEWFGATPLVQYKMAQQYGEPEPVRFAVKRKVYTLTTTYKAILWLESGMGEADVKGRAELKTQIMELLETEPHAG